jgi:hypothetical protein
MAHFAKLDENNVVTHVSVVDNWNCVDGQGNEVEQIGIDYLTGIHGGHTNWKQTSYNGNIRKNYAGIGYTYDAVRDAFIAPKPDPYPSWVIDDATGTWVPPVAKPTDEQEYVWDEATVSWIVAPPEENP